MKALLGGLAALLLLAAPAGAQAPPVLKLRADASERGRIGLFLTGPAGSRVRVVEDTAGTRRVGDVRLDAAGTAELPRAADWGCKHQRRSFFASGTGPDGTELFDNARLVTPDCDDRYRLRVQSRQRRATVPVKVRLRDTFRLGRPSGRVCASGPAGARTCARARNGRVELRLPRAGRWRIEAEHAEPVRIRVRPAPGPLKILATGDSMIQIVDGFLDAKLGNVTSDARISTGLSKPFMFNWPAHAKAQVRRRDPDAVVMFIGANDGYAFGDVACCGTDWRRAYARRVDTMMRTYAQGGAATVYWCLLPAPRPANFRRVFVGVNAAIRRAAERHRGTVRVIDLPRTFTPGFRFRQSIAWRGRSVSVRQDDGIHLNVAGAEIAASLIAARIRRDGRR